MDSSSSDARRPSELTPLGADDRFRLDGKETALSVSDFWAWAVGDLRMNTARGFLAEFLVAQAVGSPAPIRVEWAAYDVEGADGTRIEVKASGYSQSWGGPESKPRYRFKAVNADQQWDEERGEYLAIEAADRVHVWVFALHMARRDQSYDQLDLDSWSFQAVPHAWLLATGQTSAAPTFFEQNGFEPVAWSELGEAVKAARTEHERLRQEPAG